MGDAVIFAYIFLGWALFLSALALNWRVALIMLIACSLWHMVATGGVK